MNELYSQALQLLNAVWQRRWAALGVAWAVAIAGWALVVSKPNTYTASSRIFVDTASVLKPLLEGLAVDRDVTAEFEVMKQTLTTRASLEKVARLTDLDLFATTPSEMERLIDTMQSSTSVETEGRYLLSIRYSDTDPVRARNVVQALTDVFIEYNLGHNREEMEDAERFLDRQIAYYEVELEEAEERLARFKAERLSALPNQQNLQFQLDDLRSELTEAESGLQRARARQARLRRELQAGPTADKALAIFETQQALNDLLTRFTDLHPDVIALRRRLETLRQNAGLSGDGTDGVVGPANGALAASPPLIDYEQIKLQLSEADAEAAVYDDRAARLGARFERLETLAGQIPQVEAELTRLNRDYDVLKLKHGELLTRREQAKMSRESEVGVHRVQYQIVDPPRVPVGPDGPSRGVLLSIVLLVAGASGAGFGFVLSQINESFAEPGQLRQAFKLPVLGTVSAIRSPGQRTWQIASFATFVLACALLLGVYGLMMLAESRIGWANIVPPQLIEQFYGGLESISRLIRSVTG